MEELRSVIEHLRPPVLAAEGLAIALAKHVDVLRRANKREIELEVSGDLPIADHVEDEAFRIAQEALHNALRHSDAEHIAVALRSDADGLTLTIADDGSGFDADAPAVRSRRLGLTTMAERARTAGGALAIESGPGAGTTIRLRIPA